MIELLPAIQTLIANNEDFVLATVISGRGSTPRTAGAKMIVQKNGDITGTIGGGLLEGTTVRTAPELFASHSSRRLLFEMTNDIVSKMDMICGGTLEVFMEYVPADDATAEVFKTLFAAHAARRRCSLITTLSDAPARFVLADNGVRSGDRAMPAADLDAICSVAAARTVSGLIAYAGMEYWVDVIDKKLPVFLFGAGHVSREVAMLAQHVGFQVIAIDDRAEFANADRFPAPMEVRALPSFDGCCAVADLPEIDDDSFLVILTRGHVFDKLVLQQALRTTAGYIGMIGSKRKRNTIYDALRAEGFRQQQLDAVHCPVGLAMDAETPEEIAISIVGELVHVRAQKKKWQQKKSPH